MSVIGHRLIVRCRGAEIRGGDRSRRRARTHPQRAGDSQLWVQPFFLLEALHAAFLIPLWLLMLIAASNR